MIDETNPIYRAALARLAEIVINEVSPTHAPVEASVFACKTSSGGPTFGGRVQFKFLDGRAADEVWSFLIDDDGASELHCVDTATGEQHF